MLCFSVRRRVREAGRDVLLYARMRMDAVNDAITPRNLNISENVTVGLVQDGTMEDGARLET